MSEVLTNPYRYVTDPVLYPQSMGASADLTNSSVTLNTSGQLLGSGCWEFTNPDEATDQYIDADSIKAFSTNVGSITQWLYVASGINVNDFYTLCFGDASANEFLAISRENGLNPRARVHCRKATVNQWLGESGEDSWTADAWHMIAIVQDGSAVKWYFDSVEQTFSIDTDKSVWLSELTGIDNCRIGCRNFATGTNLSFFNGLMDSTCFWNTAISQETVTELYADRDGLPIPSITSTSGIRCFYNTDDLTMNNNALPIS